jgi:hypothetical protein
MNILSMLLQCGAFVFIPLTTLIMGVWKITTKVDTKYQYISVSTLIGFVFFEASLIGLLIDPKSSEKTFQEIFLISGTVGFIVLLFVLIFTPVYTVIMRALKN